MLPSLLPCFQAAPLLALVGCLSNPSPETRPPALLETTIAARLQETPPSERQALLEPLARAIARGETRQLVFICTHNSRRSHMAAIWAQTAAWHFGLEGIACYSGGTEATRFNERAVGALARAGFHTEALGAGPNPQIRIQAQPGRPSLDCWSKRFDDPPNPSADFSAVMTCSQADQACPYVPGADLRFSIPYEDPKLADGTPEESEIYDQRCAQIAREMLWTFRRAAELQQS